ncbi:MAG: EpsI family protein [Chthoniobacterales bacterium]|nr:EpsI family protein [Chthoniobacterales bacterium]
MTTKRLTVLLLFVGVGLSAIFLLPVATHSQPAGINLDLPQFVGKWYGTDQQISTRELEVLAGDTEFARKVYTDASGNSIFVSIVLSGADLDNSIHRPERCLPAQGWTIADTTKLKIPIAAGQKLGVTRLHDVRQVPLRDGKMISLYNLNYYWFVGYHHLTASHIEREMFDVKDRVLKGYNQRWAYITVASDITEGLTLFGRSEAQTDTMIQDFIRQIFPEISKEPANAKRAKKSEKLVALSPL